MRSVVLETLTWWHKLRLRNWRVPIVRWGSIFLATCGIVGMTFQVLRVRRAAADHFYWKNEGERAQSALKEAQRDWVMLPLGQFQERIRRHLEELIRLHDVRVESLQAVTIRQVESDTGAWKRVTFALAVNGPVSHLMKFFEALRRSEPFIVQLDELEMNRLEGSSSLSAKSLIHVFGLGDPLGAVMKTPGPAFLARLERDRWAWTSERPVIKTVTIEKPKTFPAWKLTGWGGRAAHITSEPLEGPPEKRLVGEGSEIYGWTIEFPEEGASEEDGVRLRKGPKTIFWKRNMYFNGVGISAKPDE